MKVAIGNGIVGDESQTPRRRDPLVRRVQRLVTLVTFHRHRCPRPVTSARRNTRHLAVPGDVPAPFNSRCGHENT